jgi:hypothetical protein
MPNEQSFTCSVCGYADLTEPPYDEHGCASFEICPSCGTEFGYDDATKPVEQLRQEWLDRGANWWSESSRPPDGWSGVRQLEEAGLLNPKS